jgi:hypothetical protein
LLLFKPFYLVYHIDLVDTPIALGIKDQERHRRARALRHDKSAWRSRVLLVQRSDEAGAAVAERQAADRSGRYRRWDDLRAQMLKRTPGSPHHRCRASAIADDRHDSQCRHGTAR